MKHALLVLLVIIIAIVCFYILRASPQTEATDFSIDVANTPQLSLPILDSSWNLVKNESGVTLYHDTSGPKNYLIVVNSQKADISINESYSHLDEQWNKATNPVCIVNGTFFEPGGGPTFPLILNNSINPGLKTDKFPVRMMYFDPGRITVSGISSNSDVIASTWGIGGINPSFYDGDSTITNRTMIAAKDNYLYVLVSQNRTVSQNAQLLINQLSIDPGNIIALDSGYSTQIRCFGEDYLASKSIIGSSLVISH